MVETIVETKPTSVLNPSLYVPTIVLATLGMLVGAGCIKDRFSKELFPSGPTFTPAAVTPTVIPRSEVQQIKDKQIFLIEVNSVLEAPSSVQGAQAYFAQYTEELQARSIEFNKKLTHVFSDIDFNLYVRDDNGVQMNLPEYDFPDVLLGNQTGVFYSARRRITGFFNHFIITDGKEGRLFWAVSKEEGKSFTVIFMGGNGIWHVRFELSDGSPFEAAKLFERYLK